ncbi:MAG: glycosyltransferase family 2 protein [Bacteroidota bacterium]|nr:glycosyltransferase family 2 protein [Bacteroidota bacterium]
MLLSILIPTHNDVCIELVHSLTLQAFTIDDLTWEVVVADDGSTDQKVIAANQSINNEPNSRYVLYGENIGRAAIRNFLVTQARGEWLLFIDGDGKVIDDDYLKKFVNSQPVEVCYGGYKMMPGPKDNLRWLYERHAAPHHQVANRQQTPYQSFNICNLMIRREFMLKYPLDNRFVNYGYEDVLLGKHLQQADIMITHIDAPIGFFDYETNTHFVAKTEEGLQTLWEYRKDLQGYSKLLDIALSCNSFCRRVILGIYDINKKRWKQNLLSTSPSLWIFNLYKLGYLLRLGKSES